MSFVLGIVLALLGAALALVLLALVLPLRCELRLVGDDAPRFTAALRPLGGLGPRLPLKRRRKGADDKGEKDDKTPARKAGKPGKARAARRWRPQVVARAGLRLGWEIVELVRIDRADVDLRFGMGDPGETGQVYGMIAPLLHGTCAARSGHVKVEPVFDEAVLAGRAALDLSLVPIRLVPPVARFGWALFGART